MKKSRQQKSQTELHLSISHRAPWIKYKRRNTENDRDDRGTRERKNGMKEKKDRSHERQEKTKSNPGERDEKKGKKKPHKNLIFLSLSLASLSNNLHH